MMRWLTLVCVLSEVAVAANVTPVGVVPDDGKDDWFAIQSAIEQSQPGDTIVLPAGTLDLSRSLDPKGGGRIIQGATQLVWENDRPVAKSQTILKPTDENFAVRFTGSDATIRNLSFAGRAINCERPNDAMVENLIVDHCWFALHVTGDHQDAIHFTTGLVNSAITNCVFDPIDGEDGIYGYNWNNLRIANNWFLGPGEGIHLTAFKDDSANLLIEQNYFAGIHRMAVEIQGGGVNTIVQDNFYEKPLLMSDPKQNENTFAYSIVSDRSHGTKVLRNTCLAPEQPDGIGVRIVFELGGQDFVCQDNYSVGANHVIAVNGTSATGVVSGNRISDFREGPRNSNGATARIAGNGPTVKLSFDINRGRPGPDRRIDNR